MNKFHIITPTYNRANLLPRAIESVLKQKYNNWHLYIIDDGSTDNTKEVVQKYLEKYPQKITYKYKENGGVGSARNIGIELALQNSKNPKNDWAIFLDSDDELTDNALEIILNEKERFNNADMIIFSVKNHLGKLVCNLCKDGNTNFNEIKNCIRGECFPIGKLEIFKKYKFPEGVNGAESIMRNKIFQGYKIYLSKEVIRIYHQDNESLIRGKLDKKKIENQIKVLNLTIKEEGENKTLLLVLARMYALKGQRLVSFKYFFKSFKYGIDLIRTGLYFISLLPFGLGLKINNYLLETQLK